MVMAAVAAAATSAIIAAIANRSGTSTKEVKKPKFQRDLIDQVLQGVRGEGEFANLFSSDQEGFQKSVADPLLEQFRTQTAPQIQQSFIQSGQQRGTPLESSLARAGLDVQGQINQLFQQFQNQGQNRQANAINSLIGIPQPQTTSGLTTTGAAIKGFESSKALPDIVQGILEKLGLGGQQTQDQFSGGGLQRSSNQFLPPVSGGSTSQQGFQGANQPLPLQSGLITRRGF